MYSSAAQPHIDSSEWSPQSLTPLHVKFFDIQRVLIQQWKYSSGQVRDAEKKPNYSIIRCKRETNQHCNISDKLSYRCILIL